MVLESFKKTSSCQILNQLVTAGRITKNFDPGKKGNQLEQAFFEHISSIRSHWSHVRTLPLPTGSAKQSLTFREFQGNAEDKQISVNSNRNTIF
jgi:hypothetical protein